MKYIDINCDMGEGGGFDTEIMPLISSCNIACGGHAGDREMIAETIEAAIQNEVAIGAHPSYPDIENFGRKSMQISPAALKLTLVDQVEMVLQEAEKQQGVVYHIKPHGALYNDLKTDREKATVVVEIIEELGAYLSLIVPPHSVINDLAQERGLSTKTEGFADRAYEVDFSLKSRNLPDAVITDKKKVLNQVLNMVLEEKITLNEGIALQQKFETICVHSDTENSLEILRYLNEQLPLNQIHIK